METITNEHFDPDLYAKGNDYQIRVAREYLSSIQNEIDVKNKVNILDIGCGDGYTTANLIPSILEHKFSNVTGVDISYKMVEYAKQTFNSDKIQFEFMDIKSKQRKHTYTSRFDYIFSFLCLQWVHEINTAVQNIREMLKSKGKAFLMFIAYTQIYDLWKVLTAKEEYKPFMSKKSEQIYPKFLEIEKKDAWFSQILNQNGFETKICLVKHKITDFKSIEDFLAFAKGLNPYDIPEHLKEQYYKDLVDEARKLNFFKEENGNTKVAYKYGLFYVVAKKP